MTDLVNLAPDADKFKEQLEDALPENFPHRELKIKASIEAYKVYMRLPLVGPLILEAAITAILACDWQEVSNEN